MAKIEKQNESSGQTVRKLENKLYSGYTIQG